MLMARQYSGKAKTDRICVATPLKFQCGQLITLHHTVKQLAVGRCHSSYREPISPAVVRIFAMRHLLLSLLLLSLPLTCQNPSSSDKPQDLYIRGLNALTGSAQSVSVLTGVDLIRRSAELGYGPCADEHGLHCGDSQLQEANRYLAAESVRGYDHGSFFWPSRPSWSRMLYSVERLIPSSFAARCFLPPATCNTVLACCRCACFKDNEAGCSLSDISLSTIS